MLRTPDVKPYIVFIKPPDFETLKETRNVNHARSTFDETNSRGFTVRFLLIYRIIAGYGLFYVRNSFRVNGDNLLFS